MLIYLGKILTLLVSPLGIAVILLLAAVILCRQPWRARLFSIATLAILLLSSAPVISDALLGSLEAPYPEVPLNSVPTAQAIVVLGGGMRIPGGSHVTPALVESSDRYLHAFELYGAGKAPLVVASGGDQRGGPPESEFAARLLAEWGVPPAAILTETKSRNTAENATCTHDLLGPRGISRILLVTSATHMHRAAALFRKAGFDVVPAAADYQTGWRPRDPLFRWLPAAEALGQTSLALKEWLGYAACRLTGAC